MLRASETSDYLTRSGFDNDRGHLTVCRDDNFFGSSVGHVQFAPAVVP
jgi:hypothetical protein